MALYRLSRLPQHSLGGGGRCGPAAHAGEDRQEPCRLGPGQARSARPDQPQPADAGSAGVDRDRSAAGRQSSLAAPAPHRLPESLGKPEEGLHKRQETSKP